MRTTLTVTSPLLRVLLTRDEQDDVRIETRLCRATGPEEEDICGGKIAIGIENREGEKDAGDDPCV